MAITWTDGRAQIGELTIQLYTTEVFSRDWLMTCEPFFTMDKPFVIGGRDRVPEEMARAIVLGAVKAELRLALEAVDKATGG